MKGIVQKPPRDSPILTAGRRDGIPCALAVCMFDKKRLVQLFHIIVADHRLEANLLLLNLLLGVLCNLHRRPPLFLQGRYSL